MHNSIPNHAEAVILVEDVDAVKAEFEAFYNKMRAEFAVSEPHMNLVFEDASVEKVYTDEFKTKLLCTMLYQTTLKLLY